MCDLMFLKLASDDNLRRMRNWIWYNVWSLWRQQKSFVIVNCSGMSCNVEESVALQTETTATTQERSGTLCHSWSFTGVKLWLCRDITWLHLSPWINQTDLITHTDIKPQMNFSVQCLCGKSRNRSWEIILCPSDVLFHSLPLMPSLGFSFDPVLPCRHPSPPRLKLSALSLIDNHSFYFTSSLWFQFAVRLDKY